MDLAGWNRIPRGYGIHVHEDEAPRWLRVWLRTPLVDRFAYPVAIRLGVARLQPFPAGETTSATRFQGSGGSIPISADMPIARAKPGERAHSESNAEEETGASAWAAIGPAA